jgi:hypothetical protein
METKLPGGITFTGGTPEQHDILRKRGEFVERYCRERGWEVDKLTIEQTLEIRSQPEWKLGHITVIGEV